MNLRFFIDRPVFSGVISVVIVLMGAIAIFFCTLTAAISALVPCLKYMLIDASPVFEAVEVI